MAGEKRDTKRTGDISEAMVLAALVRCGYTVAIPFGENQRWDAIVERDNVLAQVEYFGVYCPALEQSFLVPIAHATATHCSLRVEVTKNGQSKHLRWAHHYLLTEDRSARGRVEPDLRST